MSMITLPVVVTNVPFQGRPLLSTGMAPPPLERKEPARRMSCMALNGASPTSVPPVSSLSGPLFSMATPLATSSTCCRPPRR